MSHTSGDSDDGMFLSDRIGSPSVEKGKNSGSVDEGTILKKGPWTSAEDAILVEYVKKHGEGNWNAVQKYSGLSRCGKSCRLRWANHLRPNLKKGAFSAEEERLIVELHAKMGNKWARMAAHLPGRTDNEIKNYWNTRIKRSQRAGLPLYPAELSMHMLQDGHQAQNPFGISNGYKVCRNSLQNGPYEVSDVVFDSLRANSSIFPSVPEVSEISGSDMLMKGFVSPHYNFSPPTLPQQKRTRESYSLYHGYASTTDDAFSTLLAFEDGISKKITRSLPYSLPTDHDPTDLDPFSFAVVQGSHALINSSASEPAPEAMKLELPSLQYTETDLSSWDTSSSPPTLLESVDNFIQSPARTGKADPDSLSPRNSGLLDALVHEAKIISSGKNHSYDKCSAASASSTMSPGDMNSSCPDMCKSEWEEYGDPISPLGHSATSAFKECTSLNASRSSSDKQPPDAYSVCKVKPEPLWLAQPQQKEQEIAPRCDPTQPETLWQAQSQQKEQEIAPHCDPTRPDALLASDWIGLGAEYYKDQAPITDTIALLLGDDLCNEYKQSAGIADLGWGLSSCTWNNMPAGCNMSDIP